MNFNLELYNLSKASLKRFHKLLSKELDNLHHPQHDCSVACCDDCPDLEYCQYICELRDKIGAELSSR